MEKSHHFSSIDRISALSLRQKVDWKVTNVPGLLGTTLGNTTVLGKQKGSVIECGWRRQQKRNQAGIIGKEAVNFYTFIRCWNKGTWPEEGWALLGPKVRDIKYQVSERSEKAMAPHSSTLAWKIPWMEEPGRLQSMGSLRVGNDWATSLSLFTFMHWRRKWQPTPVCLPGESQGRGSLVGCRLWGLTESDTTEVT